MKKVESLSKETGDVKKSQMKILELKNTNEKLHEWVPWKMERKGQSEESIKLKVE